MPVTEETIIQTAATKHQEEAEDAVMLEITDPLNVEPYGYALYKDDPYGDAPDLRQKLQRMVDEEGFVIENGNPEGWPWWIEPEPVEPDTGP